ncbi:MAG TPA: hypothetical protein VNO21_08845, partial [Polyangiaceae bacterium]|nr:hypothetical protein [Polyangiaceae bacterium]
MSKSDMSARAPGGTHHGFARAAFLSELQRVGPEVLEAAERKEGERTRGADEEHYDRVGEWQEAVELDDEHFDARLAAEGLDRAHLRRLLEARDRIAEAVTGAPPWQETLRAVLRRIGAPASRV